MRLKPTLFLATAAVVSGCLYGTIRLGDSPIILTSDDPKENFGFQMEAADLTGDFRPELAVAAPSPEVSNVYIYLNNRFAPLVGKTVLDDSSRITFDGPAGSEAGWSLASARFSSLPFIWSHNLIVGAPSASSSRGEVYVLPNLAGKPAGTILDRDDATSRIRGEDPGDYLGWDVIAGDFTGDGVTDLALGACGWDHSTGRVYVLEGPLDAGEVDVGHAAHTVYQADEPGARFGCALAAGDLDGDDIDDLIVGADVGTDGAVDGGNGSVHVFLGGALPGGVRDADDVADAVIYGGVRNEGLGHAVAAVDLDNDGRDDLIMGAPAYHCRQAAGRPDQPNCDNVIALSGSVYTMLGRTKQKWRALGDEFLSRDADLVVDGDVHDGGFGISIASAGNVDGDTEEDVIIGSQADEAYLWYGGTNPGSFEHQTSHEAHAIFDGAGLAGHPGMAVAGADFTGDGRSDVAVAAPSKEFFYSDPAGNGRVYVTPGKK